MESSTNGFGLIAFGAVVGACLTTCATKTPNRKKQFRARKKEADEIEKIATERQREEQRLKKLISIRQQRAREKRYETKPNELFLELDLQWCVEDVSARYELELVQTTLEWIAWFLDPLYTSRKNDPIPIPEEDKTNSDMIFMERQKEFFCVELYWTSCMILITQQCRIGAFDESTVTLFGSLRLALQNFKDDDFVIIHVVWALCLVTSTVIQMDVGFLYSFNYDTKYKPCFKSTHDEQQQRWASYTHALSQGVLNTNYHSHHHPRQIVVAWKVSFLEQTKREWSDLITNVIENDRYKKIENLDIKRIALECKTELDHYLSISQYTEISDFQVQEYEHVAHLNKKLREAEPWIQSCSVNANVDINEDKGTFRKCVNEEIIRNRIFRTGKKF